MIQYQLVRSQRKTVAIHITNDAQVEVRAPMTLSRKIIDRLLQEKSSWIEEHLRTIEARAAQKAAFSIGEGDTLLLQGVEYPVRWSDGPARFDGRCFLLPMASFEENKPRIIALYRSLAREILPGRVERFARQIGVRPAQVRIGGAVKRWGSCSGKGNLNFSWRLILASDAAIDYVVVHELCHLKQLNHSHAFWNLVEAALPDYKERGKELLVLQQRLARQDWSMGKMER